MRVVCILGLTGLLLGCAATMPPPAPQPAPLVEAPQVREVAPAPDPQELSRSMASEPADPPVSVKQAAQAMAWASNRAVVRPSKESFTHGGAVAQLRYQPGVITELMLRFHQPTTLIFPPGEDIPKKPYTDDWWDVQKIDVGEGRTRQAYLVVTPLNDQPQTLMLTVVSSAGPYFLRLLSRVDGPTLAAVTWLKPQPPKKAISLFPAGVYQVGAKIEPVQGSPAWTPTRVVSMPERGQTWIEFPPAKLTHAAPVVYVMGPDGVSTQLVNWRDKGRYYEIDRLFDRAELRVGHDPATSEVVRIVPGDTPRLIRCPGADPECPVEAR